MAVEGITSVSSSSNSAASQASQAVNQIRPESVKQAKPQDVQAAREAQGTRIAQAPKGSQASQNSQANQNAQMTSASQDQVFISQASKAANSKVFQFADGKDAAPGELSLAKQQEQQIKAALENANKQAQMSHTSARFLYHDDINRISISIVDTETDKVIREYPAEETLNMLSKLYELVGLMVDEPV